MAIRITAAALLIPLLILFTLLEVPGLDDEWYGYGFHFYVVTAASLLAAVTSSSYLLGLFVRPASSR